MSWSHHWVWAAVAGMWRHVVGNEFVWCALVLLVALAVRWRATQDAPAVAQHAGRR